jgi:hypothetical protein
MNRRIPPLFGKTRMVDDRKGGYLLHIAGTPLTVKLRTFDPGKLRWEARVCSAGEDKTLMMTRLSRQRTFLCGPQAAANAARNEIVRWAEKVRAM